MHPAIALGRPRAWPVLLALLLGACSPGKGEARTRGGVLVIAIDGLRADHLSSFGHDRPTTPSLDALAADGVTFTQAFSSAPALLPAHVALMTGCEPGVARRFLPNEYEGLKERRWRIPARVPHLAIELLAAGFRTAAFVDDPWLGPVHGFGPGFQVYDVLSPESAEDWEGAQPSRLVERFLQWLRALDGDEPWFAYLHLNELERSWSQPDLQWDGYFQPRPELSQVPPVGNTDSVFFSIPRSRWRGGSRPLGLYEASYDGNLRALDAELERLFASLRRAGRFEDTTIHVVGTHGLQFGEAGLYLRSGRYSQADLHVPWIVRPRRSIALERGRRTAALASLLDLAPTLLELEGLAVPPGMHGLSQAAPLRDAGAAPVRKLCFASCGMQEGCALIGERYCLEYLLPAGTEDAQLRRSWFGEWVEPSLDPSLHFYDRLETPHPALAATQVGPLQEFEHLRQAAAEWLRDVNSVRLHLQFPAGASPLDEATLERLRARGFLGKGP